MSVVKVENLDISNLKFSAVTKNKSNVGVKSVYVNTKDGGKVQVQLPFLKAPFGLNRFDENSPYDISLSIPSDSIVYQKFAEFDKRAVDYIVQNSKECLGKIYNDDIIREALYRPVMRPPTNEKYDSLLKVKVNMDSDGNPVAETYNHLLEPASIRDVQKGQQIMMIVTIASLWFVDGKAGATIRLEQVMLSKSEKLMGCAFILDENQQEEDESAYFD